MIISHIKLLLLFQHNDNNNNNNNNSGGDVPLPPLLTEEVIKKIKNDDETLKSLYLVLREDGLDYCSINWSELGRFIAQHTHLTQLEIINDTEDFEEWDNLEESRQFFMDIGANKSIEHLFIAGIPEEDMFSPQCLDRNTNLHYLGLRDCFIGRGGYEALFNLLRNRDSQLQELLIKGGNFRSESAVGAVRDALVNNTTLKKLHLGFSAPNHPSIAWTCRNSALEELSIDDLNMMNGDAELSGFGDLLKDNTCLKNLKLCVGGGLDGSTTAGWEAFLAFLRTNSTLTELDLSDNGGINNESITAMANSLSSNSTLKTIRLEQLRNVERDGWRELANQYLRSPTCALESLYMGRNTIDGGTFRELGSSMYRNKTTKNLCLQLPTSDRALNAPRCGWTPWMNQLSRIVWNKRSIIESFNSNHTLEAICYPYDEARLARVMSTCPLMGKNVPTTLLMNRNTTDKKALARQKIIIAHHYNKETIADNKRYRGYKTLMETILESTNEMETTEMLPHFMSWIGRDNDGLPLMYELIQRMPTLCEFNGAVRVQARSGTDSPVLKRAKADDDNELSEKPTFVGAV